MDLLVSLVVGVHLIQDAASVDISQCKAGGILLVPFGALRTLDELVCQSDGIAFVCLHEVFKLCQLYLPALVNKLCKFLLDLLWEFLFYVEVEVDGADRGGFRVEVDGADSYS